ncbi:MAG: hypothetical protein WCT12_06480, partial [Verrucomicrobiota bacterium]
TEISADCRRRLRFLESTLAGSISPKCGMAPTVGACYELSEWCRVSGKLGLPSDSGSSIVQL